MTRTPHGLVIGKFHPLHRGHELLFRTAAAKSDRVSVLVLGRSEEAIPLDDRVRWIRELLGDLSNVSVIGGVDDHPIDYEDPAVWDLHEQAFRTFLAQLTSEPVTAVFTSEGYGDELARRFVARHVAIDPDRVLVPISATRLRADPVRHWELLPPPARAGLARRVVVLGAESTGPADVSRRLVDALRARGAAHGLTGLVPALDGATVVSKLAEANAEAALVGGARPNAGDLDWSTAELVKVASTQNELEDRSASLGGPVLVCEGDAFAIGVWHERHRGRRSAEIEALARRHHLYLLAHHDGVPFGGDGDRDAERIRAGTTGRLEEALLATGRRTVLLRGPLEERVATAVAAVDELLDRGWTFEIDPT